MTDRTVTIEVGLLPEQTEQLMPLFEQVRDANWRGEKPMVVAQVFPTFMKCGFLSQKNSKVLEHKGIGVSVPPERIYDN